MKSEVEWARLVDLQRTKTQLITDMLALLKDIEWQAAPYFSFKVCAKCEIGGRHHKDCALAAVIKRAEELLK